MKPVALRAKDLTVLCGAFRRFPAASALVVVLGLLVSLHVSGVSRVLDRSLFDGLQHLQADPDGWADGFVLVLVDETSLKEMSDPALTTRPVRWPWPRDFFAALLVALEKGGAKQILADLTFTERSEDEWQDFILASYAAACPAVVLAEQESVSQILWPPDFQNAHPALNLSRRISVARHQPDSDGVLRGYDADRSLAAGGVPSPHPEVFLLRWPSNLSALAKKYPRRVLSAAAWVKSGQEIMKQAAQLLGDNVADPEALAAILPRIPAPAGLDLVKGKTVFVGVNAAAAFDVKATPLSAVEPGVMYHLAAWSNAQKHNGIRPSGIPVLPLALLLGSLFLFFGVNEKVRIGTLIGFGLVLLLAVGGLAWALFQNNIWLPPSDLALGILLGVGTAAVNNWREEIQRKRQVKAFFGSYVSPKVLDNLLANPEAVKLGGERRELTIYFSDLAGFTDLSEGLDPAELLEVVNTYLEEMSPFIIENHGYLDKYIGDAIMGVFGSPEVIQDHAAAACKAALESRDHLRGLSARMMDQRGVALHARIGINTGDIIVGNVGSRKKRNYTVVGDAVNLASRLEGANKEFGTTIMLGEDTAAQLDDRFALRPIELLAVKGKKKPVQTYELYGWAERLSDRQRSLLDHFRRGYAAYQARDFSAAQQEFEIACRIDPDDKLSWQYSDRCSHFHDDPPPADWDGVFRMTKK